MAQGDSPDELIELARDFLSEEAVKDSPRKDKVDFLREKGLGDDDIDKLLSKDDTETELKTVHDTSGTTEQDKTQLSIPATEPEVAPTSASVVIDEPKRDVAPIITYPEFLLKPQKPPPLITVSRLINATYALAGVSALTWGASKYIVQPMLETLTEARHELADKTLQDLEKLNDKLETMVSHVPYIASSAVKRQQEQEDDTESVDSDPTELFHRDVAVQTTPGLSRSSSEVSLTQDKLDPTIAQAQRLSGLNYSLRTFVQSMDHAKDNDRRLQKSMESFQQYLNVLDSTAYNSNSPYPGPDNNKNSNRQGEAQKFKQEIRTLKGAFLSSRNFPTAPRPTATAGGYNAR